MPIVRAMTRVPGCHDADIQLQLAVEEARHDSRRTKWEMGGGTTASCAVAICFARNRLDGLPPRPPPRHAQLPPRAREKQPVRCLDRRVPSSASNRIVSCPVHPARPRSPTAPNATSSSSIPIRVARSSAQSDRSKRGEPCEDAVGRYPRGRSERLLHRARRRRRVGAAASGSATRFASLRLCSRL